MVFASDVEALELKESCLDKLVKVKARASWSVTQGIKKPFKVNACFSERKLKIGIPDVQCASCSGHGQRTRIYRENVIQYLNQFKPGLLAVPGAEVASPEVGGPQDAHTE